MSKSNYEDLEKDVTPFQLKRYILILVMVWTVIISTSLYWSVYQARQKITEVAQVQSSIAYDKDVIYRRWNASHGGIYVPITEDTKPNLYLSGVPERDITSPSGKLLTLMNPAFMTRQVHELAEVEKGVLGHITSLNPIRPENAADPWETNALQAFERGELEISSLELIDGQEYLRLMRPLITEKGCLKCHATQGYKEGDIRGGISVSIPMKSLNAILFEETLRYELIHTFIWTVGLSLIFFGMFRVKKSEQKRKDAEESLLESEKKFRSLFNSSSDAIMILDSNGFLDCNDTTLEIFGISSREEFIKQHPSERSPAIQEDGEDSKTASEKKIADAYKHGKNRFEWIHRRKNGEEFYAEVNLSVFQHRSRELLQALVMDISERKRIEEERIKNEKLKGVLEMAGAACHELNQPLQAILGYSSLISSQLQEDSTFKKQVNVINIEAERMGEITRKLQKISKYETTDYLSGTIIDIKKASE